LVGCTVVCGAATGCSGHAGGDSTPAGLPESKRAYLAQVVGLKFPDDAQFVNYHEETGGPDNDFFLKVVIRGDWKGVFAQSLVDASSLSGRSRGVYPLPSLPWWDVDKPKNFLYGQVSLPDACALRLLIDLDSEQQTTLYLLWHES
jgi:hypothetical protein